MQGTVITLSSYPKMPQCSACPKKQSFLNPGNLCKDCYSTDGTSSVNGASSAPNGNASFFLDNGTSLSGSQQVYSSPFMATQFGNQPPFGIQTNLGAPRFMGSSQPQQQYSGNILNAMPSLPNVSGGRLPPPSQQNNPDSQSSTITPDNLSSLMNKSISELTVADIIQINLISNNPIKQQLTSIENDFKKKFQTLDNRMNLLEKEKMNLEEENNNMRTALCNMQKSLNKIDSDVRNKNVIITGLAEGEIRTENDSLRTDHEKIQWILTRTENSSFDDKIDDLDVSRLGAVKPGYNRAVKIILPTVAERDEFLKNTAKMKDAPEPWNKVYVKKDQHPVYAAENNRLRKRAAELRRVQGNENKDIKIQNGKVLMDNNIVDQNMFFR